MSEEILLQYLGTDIKHGACVSKFKKKVFK